MLPKVATTIIHSTGRVAATTVHARNVLQIPGPSSTKGNNGSGYFNSNNSGARGGRFTHGYHGASRAVTQANLTITAGDGNYLQIEEQEESATPASKKATSVHSSHQRLRSKSLTQSQLEHRLNVLKSVLQLHPQSRHLFEARSNSTVNYSQNAVEEASSETVPSPQLPPQPVTASETEEQSSHSDLTLDPASPQTVLPPRVSSPPSSRITHSKLQFTSPDKDKDYTTQAVLSFLRSLEESSLAPQTVDFSAALKALYETRVRGEPLTLFLQVYNALLAKDLRPDTNIHYWMIRGLLDRHSELSRAISMAHQQSKWESITPEQVQTFARMEQELQSTLPTMLSLFRAIVEFPTPGQEVPLFLFRNVLRVCAVHGHIHGAVAVWSAVEGTGLVRTPQMYAHLIQALGKGGEIAPCVEAFEEFNQRFPSTSLSTLSDKQNAILVHNAMIEAYFRCGMSDKAVDTLDIMLNSVELQPALSTLTTLISGFCTGEGPVNFPSTPQFVSESADSSTSSTASPVQPIASGTPDITTGLSWFYKLLEQPLSPKTFHALRPLDSPSRPDILAWSVIFETLAGEVEKETASMTLGNYKSTTQLSGGMDAMQHLASLLSKLSSIAVEDEIKLPSSTVIAVASAAMNRASKLQALYFTSTNATELEDLKQSIYSYLDVVSSFQVEQLQQDHRIRDPLKSVFDIVLNFGDLDYFLHLASGALAPLQKLRSSSQNEADNALENRLGRRLSAIFGSAVARIFAHPSSVKLSQAFQMYRLFEGIASPNHLMLNVYACERNQNPDITSIPTIVALQPQDWVVLIDHATAPQDAEFGGLLNLLRDLRTVSAGQNWEITWSPSLITRLAGAIKESFPGMVEDIYGDLPEVGGLKASVMEALESARESSESSIGSEQASTTPTSPLVASDYPSSQFASTEPIPDSLFIDLKLTKSLNDHLSKRVLITANTRPFTDDLFEQLRMNTVRYRKVPAPSTLSQLAAAFGRAGEVDRIYYVYQVGQKLLATMEGNKRTQSESWFIIEDGMIIALCQAGQIEQAHVHRSRMLQMGGAPSADAYGGLILHVKDTTDDTSNAMELYQEALSQGVQPNTYLYNNIISKLAKARKADKALQLFSEMKASPYNPSPITYGAVIGACARVGDVASAETLFEEMTSQTTFKPRVPPFNTMMQLYTTTKPDRERSLWYYGEMRRLGVAPTEYTYKLLMDTYVLDPIDLPSLEATFNALVASPRLRVQSTHYATLINAYGCALKDLEKAQSVFNTIPDNVLDALVFEAMVNVLVAHRRVDLAPGYIELMNEKGIHMTAYVVNGLIKGYSAVGDIDRAREIFEGTQDSPVGVAGMHNHVGPHLNGNGEDVRPKVSTDVSPMEPVYREPSTWEAMVRAELGAGHRDRALVLVDRMKTRQYPEAVVNRVQGILVDHSQVLL